MEGGQYVRHQYSGGIDKRRKPAHKRICHHKREHGLAHPALLIKVRGYGRHVDGHAAELEREDIDRIGKIAVVKRKVEERDFNNLHAHQHKARSAQRDIESFSIAFAEHKRGNN